MTKVSRWVVGGVAACAAISALIVFAMAPSQHALPTPNVEAVEEMPANEVDALIRALPWGTATLNAARVMRFQEPSIVELLLSPSRSPQDLERELQSTGTPESRSVRISNRMEAQLHGWGFEVRALTPERQAVATREMTRWRWQVVPKIEGPRSLHVNLAARLTVEGQDAALVVKTYDQEIRVDVSPVQRVAGFLGANWQWLSASVLFPLAGYAWQRRRRVKPVTTYLAP